MYRTLISAEDLLANLKNPEWVIVDCRFSLDLPERGKQDYLKAHIPGAVYAHLNDDLSAPHVPGSTGRHPLPTAERLAATFSSLGIDERIQVVAYDDWAGAPGAVAARLWWCLRWLGHDAVAVLDGGWSRWLEVGGMVASGLEAKSYRIFQPHPRPEMLVSVSDVDSLRQDAAWRVFDSRAADRYRGENETIDPVAGHIPGAFNAPYAQNADPDGRLLPVTDLRERFRMLLGEILVRNSVFYCGSGVTAAYNLLALEHAGMEGARLYAGSWSEWITNPSRPVAKG